jgi:hypothetical protein
MDWIKYQDQQPEVNQKVIYFFEFVGAHRGTYHGNWEFSSAKGFLGGDVTHWIPDNGQEIPKPPFAMLDVIIQGDDAVAIGHWHNIREKAESMEDVEIKSIEVPVDLFLEYNENRHNKTISNMETISLAPYSNPICFV